MKLTHRQHRRLRNEDKHVKLYSYIHYGIAEPLNRASNRWPLEHLLRHPQLGAEQPLPA